MTPEVIDYLKEISETALARCHDRVADRKFFESVKKRLLLGEDMSTELQQLKHVTPAKAALILDKLIQRCDSDMKAYWAIPSGSGIQSTISTELLPDELIPRFTAQYVAKTEVGTITVTVTSKGNYTDFHINTGSVKKIDTEAAIREMGNQLLMARLSSS